MDLEGLIEVTARIAVRRTSAASPSTRTVPSVFAHDLLNANPYAFLDDAGLEERRARAVNLRRLRPGNTSRRSRPPRSRPPSRQVREESWPDLRDEHELHDLLYGLVIVPESLFDHVRAAGWRILLDRLIAQSRAIAIPGARSAPYILATERKEDHASLLSDTPDLPLLQKALHAWLNILGPQTAQSLATYLGLAPQSVFTALVAMESQGPILRGAFEYSPDLVILSEAKDPQFQPQRHRRRCPILRKT